MFIIKLNLINIFFAITLIATFTWLILALIYPYALCYSKEDCIRKGVYKARKVSCAIFVISLLSLLLLS